MVQWLRIRSELDTQRNLGMIFSVMENEYFLLFSEVRSTSGKKIEKKRKKEILKKENWRAKLWMFFFFYLRDRLRQKAGTSCSLLVQLVLLLISAPASFLWIFLLKGLFFSFFFFFWSIQHKQPTVYVTSFCLRLFLRKKTLSNFSFFFKFSCMFPTNMCFENTVKKDRSPCLFKRYNEPNVPHLCLSLALITRVISSVTVNFAAAEKQGFQSNT